MLQRLNPASAPVPFSRYSQAVIAPQGYRWLHVSGQVGCDRNGKAVAGFEAQADLAWSNVITIVKESGFAVEDIVKVTVMLTRHSDVVASRGARDRALGPVEAASTLMIVAGLASPDWLIEVEAIAARPGGGS